MFKPKKVRGQVMPGQWEQREPFAQIFVRDGKYALDAMTWIPGEKSGGHFRHYEVDRFDTLQEAMTAGEKLPTPARA